MYATEGIKRTTIQKAIKIIINLLMSKCYQRTYKLIKEDDFLKASYVSQHNAE